jgi:hypothetical protein
MYAFFFSFIFDISLLYIILFVVYEFFQLLLITFQSNIFAKIWFCFLARGEKNLGKAEGGSNEHKEHFLKL